MNLQFESLLSYIKTGAQYDDDSPIVRNVMDDIENANYQLDHKNIKDVLKFEELSKSIKSFRPHINVSKYNKIVEDLSVELFDMFVKTLIRTELHAEWKEYFHSLYDLIVIETDNDIDELYLHIIFKEMYSYWNTFEQPQQLHQTDKLYPLVSSIRELFEALEDEHFRLVDDRLQSKIVNHCNKNIEKSKECCRLNNQIRNNEKILDTYRDILQWSKK